MLARHTIGDASDQPQHEVGRFKKLHQLGENGALVIARLRL